RVGGIDRLVVSGDLRDDALDVGGEVPSVRVVAFPQPEQLADLEDPAPRRRVGVDCFGRPRVVAETVEDDVLRAGDGAAVLWRRFVVVRVGVRAGDQARDLD